jgi:hypothetical protein
MIGTNEDFSPLGYEESGMSLAAALLTSVVGAVAAALGVLAGGIFTKWAQDRQWLRDQEIAAYRDLLDHFARFAMEISRAHEGRRDWDYDWGGWSASLVAASLVAPERVARRIDEFGRSVQVLLDAAAARDVRANPLSPEEMRAAMLPSATAQVALVNAIRESIGRRDRLTYNLGGSLVGFDAPAQAG